MKNNSFLYLSFLSKQQKTEKQTKKQMGKEQTCLDTDFKVCSEIVGTDIFFFQ